jgi:hypothetical protein
MMDLMFFQDDCSVGTSPERNYHTEKKGLVKSPVRARGVLARISLKKSTYGAGFGNDF